MTPNTPESAELLPKKFFVFDVEAIGLHGEGFAVAGGTYDENGKAEHEFCMSVDPSSAFGSAEDRKWVSENVPKLEVTHHEISGMRHAFWALMREAMANGAIVVADCGWPVEARFLEACVNDRPEQCWWEGPYPLHDLASMLLERGQDPLKTNERLENELPAHHPLMDVRQSVRLLTTRPTPSAPRLEKTGEAADDKKN